MSPAGTPDREKRPALSTKEPTAVPLTVTVSPEVVTAMRRFAAPDGPPTTEPLIVAPAPIDPADCGAADPPDCGAVGALSDGDSELPQETARKRMKTARART